MGSAGVGQQKTTAGAGESNITSGQGILGNATNVANSEVNTSGGLSPLVGKQLANEEGQIGKAYQGATQAALRGNTQRGMGVGPSGLTASVENTGINNAGAARTGAIGNAFGTQNTLNNTAYAQPISALNAENGSVNASTGANTALNNMPTTAGQIFSGLQGLGNAAGNVMGGYGKMAATVKELTWLIQTILTRLQFLTYSPPRWANPPCRQCCLLLRRSPRRC